MPEVPMFSLLLFALAVSPAGDAVSPLRVSVKDRTGAPFANVLLIVKSLDGGGERIRALSDASGEVPETHLSRGLYRIIATCPYGICETKVTEFLVGSDPVELGLTLDVRPTTGDVVLSDVKLQVAVVGPRDEPASKASVLARNSDATIEKWYVADKKGELLIDALSEPMTLAVSYAGRLEVKGVTSQDIDRLVRTKSSLTIRIR